MIDVPSGLVVTGFVMLAVGATFVTVMASTAAVLTPLSLSVAVNDTL